MDGNGETSNPFFDENDLRNLIQLRNVSLVKFNLRSLNRILKGGGMVIPLIFPKVPQSSWGILKDPQLPLPLNTHILTSTTIY